MKKGTHTIGRIYTVHSNKETVFYLRMLLGDTACSFSAGKNRFRTLKMSMIWNMTHPKTCIALALLQDGQARIDVMEDASHQDLPQKIRAVFIKLMCFRGLTAPQTIFQWFQESMSEDFKYKLLPPDN